MTDRNPLRSPAIMSPGETALLVVDVQEKLIRLVPEADLIVWNIGRLIAGAEIFGVPIQTTEQYPDGLGPTVSELANEGMSITSKLTFSCGGCPEIFDKLKQREIFRIMIAGIETHVCVAQTALDLMAAGFQIYVAVDAVGARQEVDHRTALRRLESNGAVLTTTEATLFEWCRVAGTPEFKKMRNLVKEVGPTKE